MCNFPSGNFPKFRLGFLRRNGGGAGGSAAVRMAAVRMVAVRTDLGSSRMGAFGKVSLNINNFNENILLFFISFSGKLPCLAVRRKLADPILIVWFQVTQW